MRSEELGVKEFLKGVLTGAGITIVLVVVVAVSRFFGERDRSIVEAMETRYELETLHEDISNRPPGEFLEDPGIRGAADNAAADFQRKRDEAIQRIRGGHLD
jgi:hypothetical protein